VKPADQASIPELAVQPAKSHRLQLVWIIPIVAALLGGWLAVSTALQRGPTITIAFKTGEGLEAGKTKIKYKEIEIGTVKAIKLADGRAGVVATAEIAKQAANLLLDDTRLWVVRPRISGGSVSGLGTLLGGSYIGLDPGKAKVQKHEFVGLETPPVVTLDVPGTQFTLRADDLGSLDVASPIYFRRVQVGQIVSFKLDNEGVTMKVFVQAPYDQYVSSNTRFWNASGFDVSLDASGIKLETQSMVSILIGGIAFQTPGASELPARAAADAAFPLYPDRAQALKNPDTSSEDFVAVFKDSLRGLSVGAPIDFRGLTVGEVRAINASFDPKTRAYTMAVGLRLYPDRLRARSHEGKTLRDVVESPRERLNVMVGQGLRAQLRTGNLLTGQLYVALDFFPEAPKVKVQILNGDDGGGAYQIPTVPGAVAELQASLTKIAAKLEKLPLDEISADLRRTLGSANSALQSTNTLVNNIDRDVTPAAQATLEGAQRSLAAVETTLAADAPLQKGVSETLRDLSKAADSIRALTDYLERNPDALLRGKKEDRP
jgi:paraquat-inducible protein B